ncbi:MAG: hypothetical protein OEZ03_16725 [Alphaproteobacteria bacterium]|nr:hypothetical protein [Alphaproteobacteria bacterium]
MSAGIVILYGMAGTLMVLALARRDGTFQKGLRRALEQFLILAPRMFCALIAAGFIAKLIPSEFIARYLGSEAGMTAVLIASATGIAVPAGPAIAFSIGAVFAHAGASVPALIAFITSWSIFAAHRIFIYEIPLLGLSFLRLRLVSVGATPILAGLIGIMVGWFFTLPLGTVP